jgi:hypothetical protein
MSRGATGPTGPSPWVKNEPISPARRSRMNPVSCPKFQQEIARQALNQGEMKRLDYEKIDINRLLHRVQRAKPVGAPVMFAINQPC